MKHTQKIIYRCKYCNEIIIDILKADEHVCRGNKIEWANTPGGRSKYLWR